MPEHDDERFLTCVGGLFHGEVAGPVTESTYVAQRSVYRRFEVSAYGGAGWPSDLGVVEYETEDYRVAEFVCSDGRVIRMLIAGGMDHATVLCRLLGDARWRRQASGEKDRLMCRGGMVG